MITNLTIDGQMLEAWLALGGVWTSEKDFMGPPDSQPVSVFVK